MPFKVKAIFLFMLALILPLATAMNQYDAVLSKEQKTDFNNNYASNQLSKNDESVLEGDPDKEAAEAFELADKEKDYKSAAEKYEKAAESESDESKSSIYILRAGVCWSWAGDKTKAMRYLGWAEKRGLDYAESWRVELEAGMTLKISANYLQ
jgi:hypothetical protein